MNLSFDKTKLTRVTDKNYCKYKIAGSDSTVYDLYIYVKTDGTPYAAILVDDSSSTFAPEAKSNTEAATTNATLKKTGFAPTFAASPVGNVTISKTVSGEGANKDTAFPFSITVEFPEITGADSNWTYTVSKTDGGTNTSNATVSVQSIAYTYTDASHNSTNFTASLGDQDSITIAGLPYNAVVYVQETYSGGDYNITSTVTSMTGTANISSPGVTTDNLNQSDNKPVTRGTVSGASATIAFDNSRDAISPTGVVLRFAPYLTMLGVGLTTMVIAPRRKEEE